MRRVIIGKSKGTPVTEAPIYIARSSAPGFNIVERASKTIYPTIGGTVYSIVEDSTYIYIGGSFTGRFKVIDKSTKAEITGYPTFSANVLSIARAIVTGKQIGRAHV